MGVCAASESATARPAHAVLIPMGLDTTDDGKSVRAGWYAPGVRGTGTCPAPYAGRGPAPPTIAGAISSIRRSTAAAGSAARVTCRPVRSEEHTSELQS